MIEVAELFSDFWCDLEKEPRDIIVYGAGQGYYEKRDVIRDCCYVLIDKNADEIKTNDGTAVYDLGYLESVDNPLYIIVTIKNSVFYDSIVDELNQILKSEAKCYFAFDNLSFCNYCDESLPGYVEVIDVTPIEKKDKQYAYQLAWYLEWEKYIHHVDIRDIKKCARLYYSRTVGTIKINMTYEDYFLKKIKSSERALIRKAQKKGYYCQRINYDDYLEDVKRINNSRIERQGMEMDADYQYPREREKKVRLIGQDIFTVGCFDGSGILVAYYMFESYGEEIIHVVKGIGHAEHLRNGIMNFLFAYSISDLYSIYPLGEKNLIYGEMNICSGGISRFKKNVGCQLAYLRVNGSDDFWKDLELVSKNYQIHGDVGLNFIEEYLDDRY